MRRRALLTAVPAAVAATSGCIGVLTGNEALQREATPASVASSTLSETGYELESSGSDELQREVTVAGQTREVHAVNQIEQYQRSVDLGPLGEHPFGVFATIATPAFEIAGRTMSPVEEWTNRKVADRIQEQYSQLVVGDEVDANTVATLSTEMSTSKFDGTATVAGNEGVDVYLHVGKVEHREDFVLVVGLYPQRLSGEGETVRTLVGNLEHGN